MRPRSERASPSGSPPSRRSWLSVSTSCAASSSASTPSSSCASSAQRELDEAVQDVSAELAEVRSAAALAEQRSSGERELRLRLAELERRALEIHREIDVERVARERAESQLEEMRAGYRRMELLVAELRSVVGQLRAATARPTRVIERATPAGSGEQREELADALAGAVERLRARAEASAAEAAAETIQSTSASAASEPARAPVGALAKPSSRPEQPPAEPVVKPAPHKHSMSLLTRARLRRKQRRERRSAAASPPTMKPS